MQLLRDKDAGKSRSAQEFTWFQFSSRLTQMSARGTRFDQVPSVELFGARQLLGAENVDTVGMRSLVLFRGNSEGGRR